MLEMIDSLLAYNRWANRRVIDSLRSAPTRNTQAAQFFARLLSDEHAWLAQLQGKGPSQLDALPALALEQCEALADETYAACVAFFQNDARRGPDRVRPDPEGMAGAGLPFSAWQTAVQLVLRGTYVRGQIAAAIRAYGGTPPETDYLTFARESETAGSLQLSIVIPVYNEASVLPDLLQELREVLAKMDCTYELIFVDDGSTDRSLEILSEAARSDPRLKVLVFSRNFGHQAAITAGLDFAQGDAVVIMDADLQDPPEILPEMLEKFRQGYDVVSAQRISREGDGLFKRATAAIFYKLMRRAMDSPLVPDVGDFRLFSHASIVALRSLREQHRFMRGLVAWLGLRETIVTFHRRPRASGSTKYSVWKMTRFAWTAVSSFSAVPLRLSLLFGVTLTGAGFVYLGYVIYAAKVLGITTPGWPSLVALQVIFSGAMLTAIGLLGDYVARIYEESKRRPLYVMSYSLNASPALQSPERAVVLPGRTLSSSPELPEVKRHRVHQQGA